MLNDPSLVISDVELAVSTRAPPAMERVRRTSEQLRRTFRTTILEERGSFGGYREYALAENGHLKIEWLIRAQIRVASRKMEVKLNLRRRRNLKIPLHPPQHYPLLLRSDRFRLSSCDPLISNPSTSTLPLHQRVQIPWDSCSVDSHHRSVSSDPRYLRASPPHLDKWLLLVRSHLKCWGPL